MNFKTATIASGVVLLGVLVASTNSGCGKGEPTAEVPSRLARKGEACQTTNDCAAGLACLPQGNASVCVLAAFKVAQTAKECALIECKAPSDCCPTPPSSCPSYKQACDEARTAGSPEPISACTYYEANCVCDTAQRDCEEGKCVIKCVNDSTCSIAGSGGKCVGGKCAACASDSDCGEGSELSCVNGKCQPPCQGDGDCEGFDRCVEGKCVESGCQTTRECIAATRNVEATCGTDGKCIVPCQTDLECGNPKGYSFYSCVEGQCLYMGCESDKDCRLLLTGPTGSGSLDDDEHVVCRDKKVPNATTKPAN